MNVEGVSAKMPAPVGGSFEANLPPARVPSAILVLAGFVLLMGRLLVPPGTPALPWLAVIYPVLGAISVANPVQAGAPRALRPSTAFGLGAVAFIAVTLSLRHPIPTVVSPEVLAMNTLAAVSEEAFFRRLLYGRLLRLGAPVAIAGAALAFALVHVPAYGVAALWVDLGAGLLLSWQRWATGGWGAPAATHALANVLAVLR